jgi:hypothetical protein
MSDRRLLQFFDHAHLNSEVQVISKPFYDLAHDMRFRLHQGMVVRRRIVRLRGMMTAVTGAARRISGLRPGDSVCARSDEAPRRAVSGAKQRGGNVRGSE